MGQQRLRSSCPYLVSMVLIVRWVVSQLHSRTIILGIWERITQHQWEKIEAGNEIDSIYMAEGAKYSTVESVPRSSWAPAPLQR